MAPEYMLSYSFESWALCFEPQTLSLTQALLLVLLSPRTHPGGCDSRQGSQSPLYSDLALESSTDCSCALSPVGWLVLIKPWEEADFARAEAAQWGLERGLSGEEHLLLLWRPQPSLTPAPGEPLPSSCPQEHFRHLVHTHPPRQDAHTHKGNPKLYKSLCLKNKPHIFIFFQNWLFLILYHRGNHKAIHRITKVNQSSS